MTEAEIQAQIRLAVGKLPNVKLFRNNVGEAWLGKVADRTASSITLMRPMRVAYGLFAGSSDLAGWTSVTVTPEMVGRRLAVFTSAEVKRPGHDAEPHQRVWIDNVLDAGGIAGVVRSAEDALRLVRL